MPTPSLEYTRYLRWQTELQAQIQSPFARFIEGVAQQLRRLTA